VPAFGGGSILSFGCGASVYALGTGLRISCSKTGPRRDIEHRTGSAAALERDAALSLLSLLPES
jgi:hypothetical protein